MGRTQHGSISSAGSLTFSESSASSERFVTTPPGSPRIDAIWTFDAASPSDSIESLSSNSSPESCHQDDQAPPMIPLSAEATDALARLNLVAGSHALPEWSTEQQYDPFAYLSQTGCPEFFSASKSTPSEGSNGTAVEETRSFQSTSTLEPPTSTTSNSSRNNSTTRATRKAALRMDFSQMRPFEPSMGIGAPLIGCLPTPSPTSTVFTGNGPFTPRPGLTSRFSDESSSQSSNSTPVSGSNSPTSPTSEKRRIFGANLAPPMSPGGPMTPRTADALNCFGILSQSATSMLMSRSKSRDKSAQMFGVGGRFMPRSPLGMPPTMPKGFASRPPVSPLSTMDAKRAFHQLFPGEKQRLAGLLATPQEEEIALSPMEWSAKNAADQGSDVVNPYFVQ